MVTVPPTMRETTDALTSIAEMVDRLRPHGIAPPVPQALVTAAERIIAAMVAHPIVPPTTAMVPVASLPTSQLIVQLAQPGEVVDAAVLRARLLAMGRPTKTSAISVALHRAVQRGQLERVAVGRYRRQLDGPVADPPQRNDMLEVTSHDSEMEEMASVSQEATV